MTVFEMVAPFTGGETASTYTGTLERPSRDEIARLAYHLYETRDRRDGHDVDDWLSAEQQLTQQYR